MADTELSPTGTTRLPPLTSQFPQWSRATPLASLPPHPRSDGVNGFLRISKKCSGEAVLGRSEGLPLPSMANDPLLHIAQLEQNIRWLHEQHQLMLSSLHHEIDVLHQRNRDLQFQLVFSKGGITISSSSSSDSSPEDKHKLILSPKDCNTQTLQVEMLEKDVVELKAALAEAKTNNTTLTNLVDQQKKQLMAKEARSVEADYEAKLEEAERLIRRLRRENEEQRKEISVLRGAISKNTSGNGGNGSSGRHSGGRRGGISQSHDPHRFPPLLTQSYWHQSQQRSKTSPDYTTQSPNSGSQRQGRGGSSGGGEGVQGPSMLPHLNRTYSQPSGSNGNRSRYYSNGNQYYSNRGGEGKYRGRGNRDPSQ